MNVDWFSLFFWNRGFSRTKYCCCKFYCLCHQSKIISMNSITCLVTRIYPQWIKILCCILPPSHNSVLQWIYRKVRVIFMQRGCLVKILPFRKNCPFILTSRLMNSWIGDGSWIKHKLMVNSISWKKRWKIGYRE